ncbi:MAG: hypothetical protein JRE63_01870 [Deltaproteobacteria bacterium]|jgi:hypothetical protein|nr:hypothetical protein [Deltaproteobacteria bacterium]
MLEFLFVGAMIAGLRAIGIKKGLLRFEVLLLFISIAFRYLGSITDQAMLFGIGLACGVLFLVIVALSILFDLFQTMRVTGDTLAGAVCVYLLIALIWGYLYLLVEFVQPESFSFTQDYARTDLWITKDFFSFLYFSLVTMTTVGYGDMTPISRVARTLATMEGITGQVYMTILVARLVGMHLMNQETQQK